MPKSLTLPQRSSGTPTIGVDGGPAGWVIVKRGSSPEEDRLLISSRWPFKAPRLHIAVDMPIGLAENGDRGCDRLARRELPKAAKSSVFPVPARPALDLPNYAAANHWSKTHLGKGIAKQAWNLKPRLMDLDERITADDQAFVHESHPELAFRRLAGVKDLPPKKSADGLALRKSLLFDAGFEKLDHWATALPRKWMALDDLYDAAVLSLTAAHIAAGDGICLADPTIGPDAKGRKMEIWY